MAQTLKSWIESEKKRFGHVSDKDMSELYFYRDPIRPIFCDNSVLLSPADGIILYSKVFKKNEPMEIKGEMISIPELMEGHWVPDCDCLVIGIFMTFWNVHVNRIPASGLLYFKELQSIKTTNMPMLFAENDLLRDTFKNAIKKTSYQKYNARTINKLCLLDRNRDIFMVQIADSEVNVIAPFTSYQGWSYKQGERFSMIRGGSQVNLIIPCISDDEIGAVPLVDEKMCVIGTEPLVRIL